MCHLLPWNIVDTRTRLTVTVFLEVKIGMLFGVSEKINIAEYKGLLEKGKTRGIRTQISCVESVDITSDQMKHTITNKQ